MAVTLDIDRSVCDTDYDNAWNNMIWISILNLIFSSASLGLMIKYFYEMTRVFNNMKQEFLSSRDAVVSSKRLKEEAQKERLER